MSTIKAMEASRLSTCIFWRIARFQDPSASSRIALPPWTEGPCMWSEFIQSFLRSSWKSIYPERILSKKSIKILQSTWQAPWSPEPLFLSCFKMSELVSLQSARCTCWARDLAICFLFRLLWKSKCLSCSNPNFLQAALERRSALCTVLLNYFQMAVKSPNGRETLQSLTKFALKKCEIAMKSPHIWVWNLHENRELDTAQLWKTYSASEILRAWTCGFMVVNA